MGRELRGGQHQALLLLNVLRAAGHDVTLLAPGASPLYALATQQGFQTAPVSLWQIYRLSAGRDVVHAHDARAHTWAAIASRKPFVVSRRVAFPVSRALVSRWKYARAARFLAVSKFVAGKLREAGVPQSKIDVVYDAVEVSRRVLIWQRNAPVVALANFDPQKGRDLIERASEIARIPVTFSNDLSKDLSHASAFVYVSRSEGFGSAALLAMKLGVPLIASPVDGMAEVFEDGISGLAAANDADSIAAAMRRLFQSPQLAQALIENAYARVNTRFNTTTLAANTLKSYRRAIAL
jgi:glycosyltransferase involved in cell wall biosynthesis